MCPTPGVAPPLLPYGAPQGSPLLIQGRRLVVVAWKNQFEYDGGWGIPGPILDDPGPIKLPFSPACYTTSTGAVRGSWCLQDHVASAFPRGVQRNVDDSRGAAVISSLSRRRRARQFSGFLGSPPWITSGSFCVLGFEFSPWVVPGAFRVLRSSSFSLGSLRCFGICNVRVWSVSRVIGLGSFVRAFFFLSYRPCALLGPGWSLFARLFAFPLPSRRPSHSVLGHGLGNRAAKQRHGTVGSSCSFFFVVLPTPSSSSEPGGGQGNLATHTVAQDGMFCLISFVMHVVLFSLLIAFSARHLPPSWDCGLCHLSIS